MGYGIAKSFARKAVKAPFGLVKAGPAGVALWFLLAIYFMNSHAQQTPYFESAAGHIYYHTVGYVRLAWAPGRLPPATIEAYYEQVLLLLRSTNCRRILSEHGQRAPLPAEAQTWITTNWIPRAMSLANTRRCAIMEGANPMHRLATQSVVNASPAGFLFKRFDNFPDAEAWLLN